MTALVLRSLIFGEGPFRGHRFLWRVRFKVANFCEVLVLRSPIFVKDPFSDLIFSWMNPWHMIQMSNTKFCVFAMICFWFILKTHIHTETEREREQPLKMCFFGIRGPLIKLAYQNLSFENLTKKKVFSTVHW